MKWSIFIIAAAAIACTSCSSTGLTGSLPIPFTDPPVNAKGNIEVTPLPPKICIGVDVVPRPEE